MPHQDAIESHLGQLAANCMAKGGGPVWGPLAREAEKLLHLRLVRAIGAKDNGVQKRALGSPGFFNDADLHILVIGSDGSLAHLQAELTKVLNNIPCRTLMVISEGQGWCVTDIFDFDQSRLGKDTLSGIFPGSTVHLLKRSRPGVSVPTPEIDQLAVRGTRLRDSDYKDLVNAWDHHLSALGLTFDEATRDDALSAMLSSQFIMMAGPSGTGKSSLMEALATFFCPPTRWLRVDTRRQWLGPEDVVGFLSAFDGRYVHTQYTSAFAALHGLDDATPALLFEEINLSTIEAYLSPIVHGLSAAVDEVLKWTLFTETDSSSSGTVRLGPYPRVIGTLNVDATAAAPARKVAGRASIVLLEPNTGPSDVEDAWAGLTGRTEPHISDGEGVPWLGDPRHPLHRAADLGIDQRIRESLEAEIGSVHEVLQVPTVTQRSLRQCLLYAASAAAVRSARAALTDSDFTTIAQTALLHHVLPGLDERQFQLLVEYLNKELAVSESLLSKRLGRLAGATSDDDFGGPRDFWARLT